LISDYTVLPMGTKVEGGVVKVCPKCQRRGLNVEMDGHSFYTHFQSLSKDNPGNVFIRRVECHLLPKEAASRQAASGEAASRNTYQALPNRTS
jgi:hypothetical protein